MKEYHWLIKKIDVEGAESEILEGTEENLNITRNSVIESNHMTLYLYKGPIQRIHNKNSNKSISQNPSNSHPNYSYLPH